MTCSEVLPREAESSPCRERGRRPPKPHKFVGLGVGHRFRMTCAGMYALSDNRQDERRVLRGRLLELPGPALVTRSDSIEQSAHGSLVRDDVFAGELALELASNSGRVSDASGGEFLDALDDAYVLPRSRAPSPFAAVICPLVVLRVR